MIHLRKIFAFLLAFYFLVVSSGLMVSFHFCEGVLSDVAFFNLTAQCNHDHCSTNVIERACCNVEDEPNHGSFCDLNHCCTNTEIYVQVQTEAEVMSITQINVPTFICLLGGGIQNLIVKPDPQTQPGGSNEFVPSSTEPYLRFHQLLFYA